MINATAAQIRKAAAEFEKETGKKLFIEISGKEVESSLFRELSKDEALDFLVNRHMTIDAKALTPCRDYGTRLFDAFSKFCLYNHGNDYGDIHAALRRAVELHAQAIGCHPAVLDEEGYIVKCDADTMYNKHNTQALKDAVEGELAKLDYTVSFI